MSNSLEYPNKKCTFAYRVVRQSKSQNISALALSLNRYHKSATPSFYSDIQSDTSFLIIRDKDSASERKAKENSAGFSFAWPNAAYLIKKPVVVKPIGGDGALGGRASSPLKYILAGWKPALPAVSASFRFELLNETSV